MYLTIPLKLLKIVQLFKLCRDLRHLLHSVVLNLCCLPEEDITETFHKTGLLVIQGIHGSFVVFVVSFFYSEEFACTFTYPVAFNQAHQIIAHSVIHTWHIAYFLSNILTDEAHMNGPEHMFERCLIEKWSSKGLYLAIVLNGMLRA